MPVAAAAHLRACAECRDYVRRWDRIELGLQALRDSAPLPSADFRLSLEAASSDPHMSRVRNPLAPRVKWAAVTAAAAIGVIALGYSLLSRANLSVDGTGSLAIVRPAQNSGYVPRANLDGSLPLSQTR